ncbi:TPA: hypothetical protein ACLXTB_001094 [Streptococcus pneumoniae]|uniref:hypothetical protein n=1 Tax=Streptococcus pneumoniae TaxID=1313 RepID=UPI0005DC4F2C|nr:hypothetical protein [Streptococcus pneumoniae]KXV95666.1 hypothetical protein NTPn10_09405 [Streptococcus pneumoniae]MBW5096618.1 hypothetical protein [Streptococcus pneumoniae]MBW5113042.1 hypothetical protein [Streptococcus pneumoniae]MDA2874977.1 hypothetical protein [Streptococcus pneumoniae]MDD0780490.1 hypothetical protein [Streptococcus pneumoniae]
MKSFKDFRESLTAEDMQAISAKDNEATKQIDHTDGLQLGKVSGLTSVITTIELLEKYHEWLHS